MKYLKLFEEFKIDSERSYNIGDTISGVPGSDTSIVVRIDERGKPISVMARLDVHPLFTQRDIKELYDLSDAKSIGEILRLPENKFSGNSGWRGSHESCRP